MIYLEVYLYFVFFYGFVYVLVYDVYNLIKYFWIKIANRSSYVSLVGKDIEGLARMESAKV